MFYTRIPSKQLDPEASVGSEAKEVLSAFAWIVSIFVVISFGVITLFWLLAKYMEFLGLL